MSTPTAVRVHGHNPRGRNQGRPLAVPTMPAWYWRLTASRHLNSNAFDYSYLYGRCPWLLGTGTCSMGCDTEPECITGGYSPDGGWPLAPLVIRRAESNRNPR